MKLIITLIALILLGLPNLISPNCVHLVLTFLAAHSIGCPSMGDIANCMIGILLAPIFYILSILLINFGLPRLKLRARVSLAFGNILDIFTVVLIEEFSWRVFILEAVDSILWRIVTSMYFVYLHFRNSKEIVVMEWIEMLIFTGSLVWFMQIFKTPWVGIGLHFGRNVISTLIYAEETRTSDSIDD